MMSPAPPHTRGSTLRTMVISVIPLGSPAHAGIDLPPAPVRIEADRLPRTRGDRPPGYRWAPARCLAPPHTRGSTLTAHRLTPSAAGSPAHAGIDPPPPPAPYRQTRLPRTRGDRPLSRRRPHPINVAPPHTRGSTLIEGEIIPDQDGSPAHAGIDPPGISRRVRACGLPRTRGDRPGSHAGFILYLSAPPHTRGST